MIDNRGILETAVALGGEWREGNEEGENYVYAIAL